MRRRVGPPYGPFAAPNREQAEYIDRMLKALPKCRWCRKPVAGGQVDGEGQPSHFQCQIAFLLLSKPFRRAAPINPRLPQAEYLQPKTTVGERLTAERTR